MTVDLLGHVDVDAVSLSAILIRAVLLRIIILERMWSGIGDAGKSVLCVQE